VATITYYTLTLADFSAINYFLKLSQTLHLHTRNSRRDLTPRIHFLQFTRRTAPYKLLLRHSSSSYIVLNRTTVGKRPLYCCANRITCVANRCGATKYKHSSLLLARLTSALFGFLQLSSARYDGNTVSAWCNTSQYIYIYILC
jgi:hypothetical protein